MKKILSLLISVIITFSLAVVPVSALSVPLYTAEELDSCPYRYINDLAEVLTDEEEKAINEKLIEFIEKNKLELVVITVCGVSPDSRMEFADDYYDRGGYGYGESRDGALLLVNIGENGVYSTGNSWISTCGKAIESIDGDIISKIGEELTPLLLSGRYSEAFNAFPDFVKSNIGAKERNEWLLLVGVAVLVCIIIAFIYVNKLKKELKSVQQATDANNYIVENSLKLSRSYDHFLYSHISKVRRSTDSGSSSSSHTSSSGTSHGGGGF